MFDVSFFELLVIGVVALLVIGPEKLPGAIRTGALWFGRLKRTITETRAELEKHIGADEIRRTLHNEQVMASLEKLKESRAALERDLMDYQAKINAELEQTAVIDQAPEITQDLGAYDHHRDHDTHIHGHDNHRDQHGHAHDGHIEDAEIIADSAAKPHGSETAYEPHNPTDPAHKPDTSH